MARKKDPNLPGLVQSNVRMPQPVIDEIDAWVDELNQAAGWEKFTRSDIIRNAVEEALERRRAAKAPAVAVAAELPARPEPVVELDPGVRSKKGGR